MKHEFQKDGSSIIKDLSCEEFQAALTSPTNIKMMSLDESGCPQIGPFTNRAAASNAERRIKEAMEPQTNGHSYEIVYDKASMGSSSHNFKPANS